ncbi:unnamed protein product [Peniophora sp. CBMAI 1063]|nr:unnamed protein product [Peniophora sp. CBMAI 1063]
MSEGDVIDLTNLPDDPPAPTGLDPQQRAMAQHLLNIYPRDFLRDALSRLLERQDTTLQLAVYQALLASVGPAALQGPPGTYIPPPGIQLPPYAAYAMDPPIPAPANYQRMGIGNAQPVPYADDQSSEDDEDEDEPQYEVCTRCNEEFDPDNDDESCSYHSGYLEIDYHAEGWADWDEDVHGPMDTDEHREEWPENFTWTCCGRAGDDASGCEEGPHTVHSNAGVIRVGEYLGGHGANDSRNKSFTRALTHLSTLVDQALGGTMASSRADQSGAPSTAATSSSPPTSFVFAPTRSSLARRTAVLSKDALDRHAAGASRYRPRFSTPFDELITKGFSEELFTKGFVPLGGALKSHEAPTGGLSARVASAPVLDSTSERSSLRPRRALSETDRPPTPPPTPYGHPAPPTTHSRESRAYSKISLSELTDMVVQASLTPAAASPSSELELARAYPFPSHHRHRSNSQREYSARHEDGDQRTQKMPHIAQAPQGDNVIIVPLDGS